MGIGIDMGRREFLVLKLVEMQTKVEASQGAILSLLIECFAAEHF